MIIIDRYRTGEWYALTTGKGVAGIHDGRPVTLPINSLGKLVRSDFGDFIIRWEGDQEGIRTFLGHQGLSNYIDEAQIKIMGLLEVLVDESRSR